MGRGAAEVTIDIGPKARFFGGGLFVFRIRRSKGSVRMSSKNMDRRSETRYEVRLKIEYLAEVENCERKNPGPRETFTTDISYRGMGFYSDCPIEKGQTIEIFLRHVFKKPILAEVRWFSKLSDNLYKLGVQYLTPPPSNLITAATTQ
jgi:hypothetical protein